MPGWAPHPRGQSSTRVHLTPTDVNSGRTNLRRASAQTWPVSGRATASEPATCCAISTMNNLKQPWWTIRNPVERAKAKAAATAITTPPPKPPKWRRIKGPRFIRHGPGYWESSYRRVEHDGTPAESAWAKAQALCPTFCPRDAIPHLVAGRLVIEFLGKRYPILCGNESPSDIEYTVQQIRYAADAAERGR